ncbi:hypothetical protein HYFRA_00001996 [Hymenoscyphus fraxineus]|uniref:Tyrosinase copper-binding domain-containing protein n=1 Tax=Hymenoscyphus fraxineus TaxID=746836 RepID=A0A9N9KKY1_9HELO|nr:hypothetical protein HYFRA_00001996 [Hymenoscyphus fraxineus]
MILPKVLALAFTCLTSFTAASPVDSDGGKWGSDLVVRQEYPKTQVRKEWRKLSNDEKLEWIDAVKCMLSKPALNGAIYSGSRSRYGDFMALHIQAADYVHFNGPFLPWHRHLLILWEQELRNTCGYTGSQPWWDFSLENTAETFPKSPLFDPVYGVGGNGPWVENVSSIPVSNPAVILADRTGGGCLDNGPFANLTVTMGIGNNLDYNPHCLRRDFCPELIASALSDERLAAVRNAPTFNDFNIAIQGKSLAVPDAAIHLGLHIGIGGQVGELADTWSSPGDPLFYIIHSTLDKLWNDWQRADWDTRKSEISGPDAMWGYPFDFFGPIPYNNITLDYSLNYTNFGSSVTIRSVMDIEALGYTYDD